MFKRLTALFVSAALVFGAATLSASAIGYRNLGAENAAPSVTVESEDGATVTFLTADRLSYTASYGSSSDDENAEEQAFSAEQIDAMQNGCGGITTASVSGLPYQVFDVDVSNVNGSSIVLSFDGSTLDNERMALKVYNPKTSAWDTLGTAVGCGQIGAQVTLADYASEGTVRAMVTPDYVSNGSNRILWSTDPQHYVKFKDLNATYKGIHEYMVSEYKADNLAYVVTTGDIVDDMPNLAGAKSQWITASSMYEILDKGNVPYGIVTGNHDTGNYPAADYVYYDKYFSAERYESNAWYGGTEDDNRCHYDLVTVGNIDLLFLYLGYGIENTDETIDWANKVLDMYPNRNAIICTHQYLSSRKVIWKGRAEDIFSYIIDKHDNVMMVLCGHDDGATRTSHETSSGRTVYEVLSDYQFVQVESTDYYADCADPFHYIGGYPYCNGEGYLREITIDGDCVSMDTFSPITGGTQPYGVRDVFTLDVDFIRSERKITTNAFTAAVVKDTLDTVTLSSAGEATTTKSAGNGAWIAKIEADSDTLYTVVGGTARSNMTVQTSADKSGLSALIDRANAVQGDFTKETWSAMQEAKKVAADALKSNDDTRIADAYKALAIAVGQLTEIDDSVLLRSGLEEVYTFDLATESWKNESGAKKLTDKRSYVVPTVTEEGGLTLVASDKFPNNDYPQVIYTEPVEITPKDGKLYLYLDIHSENGWSLYPTIVQGKAIYEGRWNYIIEGLKDKTGDAGNGDFIGVYDVTEALVDMGVDPEEPMIMTMKINVVPGPLTINEISILTGEYHPPFSLQTIWPWLLLGLVVILAVAAVLIAVMYNPKKAPVNDAAANDAATVSEQAAPVKELADDDASPDNAAPANEIGGEETADHATDEAADPDHTESQ